MAINLVSTSIILSSNGGSGKMRIKRISLITILVVAVMATALHAQVPKPTLNLVGSYLYNSYSKFLFLSTVYVTSTQYLDGSTSATDPIVGAKCIINYLQYIGMDENGDALFTDGTINVSKTINGVNVTYMTANLVDVRLTQMGFGSFGNLNVGFETMNVTNVVFSEGTGSRFVEEFAGLIAPEDVPNEAALQLEMQLVSVYPGQP